MIATLFVLALAACSLLMAGAHAAGTRRRPNRPR